MARQRAENPMPEHVHRILIERGLADDFAARPWYQRNDYLGWIGRAKRADTRQRRLDQMLNELAEGGVYMGMDHPASRR